MARVSMRDLIRFRSSILTYPSRPFIHSHPFSSYTASEVSIETPKPSHRRQCFALLDQSQSLIQVSQIHARLISSGRFDSYWARKVLKFYWDFCHVDYTILIFRYIDFPGTYCINTVLKAYSLSASPNQAVIFYFEWLREGFYPNCHTFVPLVGSCAKMGCVESGRKCHGQAVKNGVDTVLQVQNSLVHMYACCGRVELAYKVFDEMSTRDLVSWNSLVDGYARLGYLDFAHRIFDLMPERNVISWNIITGGYLKGGIPGCVFKLFRRMVKTGMRGDNTTMVNVLTACGRSARLKEGRSVHGFVIRTTLKSSLFIDAALIDMYSKCQRVKVASRVFDNTAEKNLVCWNAMILGHCIHGNPEDGINMYKKMVGKRRLRVGESNSCKSLVLDQGQGEILPDAITFIGVLCASARARLLEEGRGYFHEMINIFRIKPNFAHYWCMANIFVSVGLIQSAEEIIRNIPQHIVDESSDSLIWANLLSLCRFEGDVSLGEQTAKSLIDREPQNLSYYRLMLNVYAVAGRWEDVARVKETVKGKIVGRMPGCNLVDLRDIVHDLRVGEH
ncbi:Tetratricopeptide-like helical domain containing protein [Parasponia andersonii]|uniref:Tetratricopeptide-like helical domain containing protein n=1 Tax=Parasponia andersonii TaxID=3476 RepID=A0A2P5BXK5_PARAD|nr:Tetratricopeptide-like helical domain containing protein [Parasponia andersonii]